jgi:beta-lactamase class A
VSDAFEPLAALAARTAGRHGLLVQAASGEVLFARAPDEPFPAASVVKIALVMALYADAAEGRLSLDERLPVGEPVPGSGVLRLVAGVRDLPLRDLAALTIAVSDNTAANLLIDRLGLERIAERLRGWGIRESGLRRKMYDLEAKAGGLENVMTPRETAALLLRLLRGECVDRPTSEDVVALLRECQDGTRLRRYLPSGVDVANKSGWLEGIANDAGIIFAARPVVVAGFTADLPAPEDGGALLGLLGWCAYRAAGGDGPPLPLELSRPA